MTEAQDQRDQTGQTAALYNLRATLPDEYRRALKMHAARHGISVNQAVEDAIRTLVAHDGWPMSLPSSYAQAS